MGNDMQDRISRAQAAVAAQPTEVKKWDPEISSGKADAAAKTAPGTTLTGYAVAGGSAATIVGVLQAIRALFGLPWGTEGDAAIAGVIALVILPLWVRIRTWIATYKADAKKHGGTAGHVFLPALFVLALVCLAALPGCMTWTDADGKTHWSIDQDEVKDTIGFGLDVYDSYKDRTDQIDAEISAQEQRIRNERMAFWGASASAVLSYRNNVKNGAEPGAAALAAIADANRVLELCGVDKTFLELARSAFSTEVDRPSDVDIALEVLKDALEREAKTGAVE